MNAQHATAKKSENYEPLRDNPLPPQQPIKQSRSNHPLLSAFASTEYGTLLLQTPEGIEHHFGGKKEGPRAQIRLHSWQGLDALIAQGEVGFAEAYMAGSWETENLTALLTFGLLNGDALERYFYGKPWYALWLRLRNVFKKNSVSGSKRNITAHYDLGNAFYSLWLDESMTYSCGLFGGNKAMALEQAQAAKYNRILDKFAFTPGAHILEIGCGWGGFAEAAARRGFRVTGLTISEEQKTYADQRLRAAGLDHLATIKLEDYRNITGEYDYIASIGMFEHVGEAYWPGYFNALKQLLKPGGTAMVQTITLDDRLFEELSGKLGFIEVYIFPGGVLPSKKRFSQCVENGHLELREMFAFGQDYAITLTKWLERFEAQLHRVRVMGYNESFIRMWRFYLCACIASFTVQRTDVMQVELRKP